ncbi:MAG: hypothetical protein IJC16_02605, partial [Rikenellaceae bacterium]|nr:hypothetical protein [Rikenellaceae bacterium]
MYTIRDGPPNTLPPAAGAARGLPFRPAGSDSRKNPDKKDHSGQQAGTATGKASYGTPERKGKDAAGNQNAASRYGIIATLTTNTAGQVLREAG